MPAGRHGDVQTRLRWWALALPLVAFAALFSLMSGPASAASGTPHGGSSLARIIQVVQHSVLHHGQ
ncbi:hypothetical protein AB0K09_31660 [Streptomyces sp. NPDC049577]|uniref:hypothetical protein n=1 Tax=Streptomyces sp. NPDC049577 TaxID=3155153 RepID=UPI003417B028